MTLGNGAVLGTQYWALLLAVCQTGLGEWKSLLQSACRISIRATTVLLLMSPLGVDMVAGERDGLASTKWIILSI